LPAQTTNPYATTRSPHTLLLTLTLTLAVLAFGTVAAGPLLPAGDTTLRHDIQLLADRGIIKGPVTSWPLAWGPVLAAIRDVDRSKPLPGAVNAALERLSARAEWETRTGEVTYSATASAAEAPTRLRSFQNTPRETAEIGAGLAWTGERVSITLKGQLVDRSGAPLRGQAGGTNGTPLQGQADGTDARADGSMIGIALGNWSLSANTLDRWWGPGWDGSIILSNNARPIPAVSLDRNFTDAFDTKWLSWLGPWDVSVMMGQLESAREIPNALFFGMRFNFRPVPSLEIGLTRTAQWCGDDRPCDAETFADLLLGRDNRGDAGIEVSNEPGNQMAGVDFRWSQAGLGWPTAIYGQFIGEDEAGGFPSKFLGQAGVEMTGLWQERWSWRGFAELASTKCRFYEGDIDYNCAYNHGIYRSGYRYRGRGIGHGADNDARLVSAGLTAVNADETEWRLLIRHGELNRGGAPDTRHTLTPVPEDITSIDVSHARAFRYGLIEAGIGFEQTDNALTGSDDEARFYLQWRSAY